jgi:S-DNA-T family DNA segregation ATPase FtsK/SpoIIIE
MAGGKQAVVPYALRITHYVLRFTLYVSRTKIYRGSSKMAMRDILDRQAGTIEYVLHTHGIRAQVDSGKLSPRLAHFHIVLPQGVRPAQIAPMVPELASALGVTGCRLANAADGLYLEAPRPDPVPVRLLPLVQRVADVVPPATATLGLDTDGTPLLLRLNSPEVDPVIVAGEEGAGKSSLLRSMVLSIALHNSPDRVRLLLLDCTGEGIAFHGLEQLPHLACPIAGGPVDALVSLRWALRMLSRRTHAGFDGELFFDDEEPASASPFDFSSLQAEEASLLVLIDGADRLCSSGNRRADAEAADALRRLLSNGSSHGIHLVMSAERPDEIVGVNPVWGARIVGVVNSAEDARVATGVKGSGAQGLLGDGDFLVTLNAELIRFQAAAVSSTEVARAVDLICACATSYPQPNVEQAPARPRMPNRRLQPLPNEPRQASRLWSGE